MPKEATLRIISVIQSIPPGRVASYGSIAEMSGYPGGALGARQVARILSSMSRAYELPWWRVVKKDGSIALEAGEGRDLQVQLLEAEGVEFAKSAQVDMARFGM